MRDINTDSIGTESQQTSWNQDGSYNKGSKIHDKVVYKVGEWYFKLAKGIGPKLGHLNSSDLYHGCPLIFCFSFFVSHLI